MALVASARHHSHGALQPWRKTIYILRLCNAGLRQVRPGGRLFPAWFDIYPNTERVQEVDAPVCVLHVRARLFTAGSHANTWVLNVDHLYIPGYPRLNICYKAHLALVDLKFDHLQLRLQIPLKHIRHFVTGRTSRFGNTCRCMMFNALNC